MATLRPYKKYNSVVYDYATELPDGWQLWKIAHAFNLIGSGTTPQSGNISFYESGTINWINTGDLNDGVINECKNKITELAFKKHSVLKIYPKGTLLVAMYGATIGKAAVMNLEGCTNQACCALSKSKILTNKFTLYWFIANRKNIVNLSYGGGQPNISQDVIKKLKIPVPPLGVQNSIVTYLDKKNSEIDKFIRNKERLVELLEEEKQSEIDKAISLGINNDKLIFGRKEIPNYPSHWQLKRTKHLFSILNGYAFSTDLFISEGVQVLKISSLYQNELSLDRQPTYVDRKYLKKLKQFVVTEGNILMSLTGTLGKKDYGYAIQLKTDELYLLNQRVAKLIPKSIIDGNYALYLLRSDVFLNQLYMCPSGTKQANLSNDDILSLHIAIPGKFEQIEIANYLNTSLAKFDIAISKAQKEISSIKEYREALITDLVTGKRSVQQV
jgi:type I restriction enzyme S subunit